MDVAKSNSIIEPLTRSCSCYKVHSLSETILEANQISSLKDRYVLGEQLGLGQFGVIRLCSDKLTGEVLACKSIGKDRLVTSDDVNSVKLEIEIMTRLSGHPNVVDLKAVYEEEDYVHLVMELCAGGELFHQLEKKGRFSESEARILFRHLMHVVIYCHENGVVHRDLKPENILLATKASSSQIKLADFGLATYIKPGKNLHGLVGSPFYIAPEVLAGGYNQAADVWSSGVILYILLSGMPPFWGKTKSQIFDAVKASNLRFPSHPWDRISIFAKDLIKNMLSKDPSQRLTAQQVLDHSWMKNDELCSEEHKNYSYGDLGVENLPSSVSFMSRSQDISFGTGSPTICDTQSPADTCRSSFSSFLVQPPTPCLASGGFSFHSTDDANDLEFTSQFPAMPSFAFFGLEQNCSVKSAEIAQTEDNHGDGALISYEHDDNSNAETNKRISEVKRAASSRIFGIHGKRNRTIGLGERDRFDLIGTESVIRWSSCTHLPTSLRSSLVC